MGKFFREFWYFGVKQANACLFGGFLLLVMILTSYWYPIKFMHRYDFIFLTAIVFQLFLLVFKLETLRESLVIIIFHIVATVMELFKTSDSIASWTYPEEYFFGVGNVPLFTGFMYSAVGSYIARVWRLFEFKYSHYPSKKVTLVLVSLIYINFFSHHFIWDIRWLLLSITIILFLRTNIYYKVINSYQSMPLLIGWFLVALFIWFAENLATFANVWIYPNQKGQWEMVSISKLSSWYLLMLLSFVLVSLINKIKMHEESFSKS